MGDSYLEYIIKKAPETKSSLLKIAIIAAAAVICYIGLLAMATESLSAFSSFILLAMAGVVYGAYRLIISFNFEYEYIVTNGDLDVDKIIARRDRKRLCSISTADVEVMAPYDDINRHSYDNGTFALTVDATSSKYAQNRWFITATTKKYGRVRVMWEPTEKMVENMRSYMPRKVMKAQ